jgi:hypothetical protein
MRATLHDPAPNTYYGQWPGEKAVFPGLESPAIAHHELLRAPDSGPLTFRSEISQGIARRCVGNVRVDQKKICAPGEGARFRRQSRSPLLSKATAL